MKTNQAHIKALAFDLDGTLVDSAPGLCQGINQMLKQLDLPQAEPHQVACWIGNGADILVERALRWAWQQKSSLQGLCPANTPFDADARSAYAGKNIANELMLSDEQCKEARHLFDSAYQDVLFSGTQLFAGVKQVLSSLLAQHIPMALVTNKPTRFVAPLLSHLDIDAYFSLIIGGDDVAQKKPHPAPLYYVLAKLGLYAHELLFVGDSRNDILAAQAAGCLSAGMTYGYNYGEDIALSRPDYVLEHFPDLLPLITQ